MRSSEPGLSWNFSPGRLTSPGGTRWVCRRPGGHSSQQEGNILPSGLDVSLVYYDLLWFLCYLATLSEKCPKQVTCTRTVNVQRYCCELLWGSMRDVIAILHATNHADRSGTKSCKSTVHVGTRCHGQEPPSFALCRSNAAMPLGQSFWVILLPLERHPENSAGLRSLTNVHCTFECWPPWFCSQMFFSILFIVFFLVFSLFVIMHCHPTSSINIQSACQPVHLQPLILYHWTKSLQVLLLALPSPWPYDYSL